MELGLGSESRRTWKPPKGGHTDDVNSNEGQMIEEESDDNEDAIDAEVLREFQESNNRTPIVGSKPISHPPCVRLPKILV